MPFSLAYASLCICSIYLALKKDKENKRRCIYKFGDRDTSSKITQK